MRKIIVATFLSMDGVLQAPGGPQEDPTNNFTYGGWMFPYGDETTNQAIGKLFSAPFDLLLGHFTYDIFAAHWPYQQDEIGEVFNRINKYVVATKPVDLSWHNSILISGDVVAEIKKLKEQDGPALLVHGSSVLAQTLLQYGLIDELHTWIHPLTLGTGKKLFGQGAQAQGWKLTDSVVSTTGVIIASYAPDGEVKKGSFVPDQPSEKELERREKIKGL
ncbi:dihydrofolate reductase family protein [Mucilaginibacter ximonensis]|uniref:Dihydrofolate reductase family protein n=1 Tax=Mucilaginibacter ximonensis TaxID=538021 RepID=A0ABW5Y8F0_9SPHI